MGDVVVLDVQDDGVGFDPAEVQTPPTVGATGGFGLAAMRERVEQLGGTLLVESARGEGTTLVVEIPIPEYSASQRDE
jgi:signal transduction histidine kinase